MTDWRRKNVRLWDYDYSSPGWYFITINIQTRTPLFGECRSDEMFLNIIGEMISNVWTQLPLHYPGIESDSFIIMPDHIHGILAFDEDEIFLPYPHLGDVIKRFKSTTTHRYGLGVKEGKWPRYETSFWQRGYYEHVIRDETDLENRRKYIERNPWRWCNQA